MRIYKQILAFTFIMGLNSVAFSQQILLHFEKTNHSFGKVKQNTPITFEFTFTNTSGKTIIIEDATAECGCTKPEFPPRPITSGKTGVIKVTYDAKNVGVFTKKVTVTLVNEKTPIILSITGEVIE